MDKLVDRFKREIWVDCACAVSEQRCKVMHLARLGAFEYDRKGGSALCCYKVLVKRRYRKQRRNCKAVLVNSPVGENQDVRAVRACLVRLNKQAVDRLFEPCVFIVKNRDHSYLEALELHVFEL